MSVDRLQPALPLPAPLRESTADNGPVWVGSLDVHDLEPARDLELEGGSRFRRARLLIWDSDRVRGFVEVKVISGRIASGDLRGALASLPEPGQGAAAVASLPTSIIVCTRDRPNDLERCLASIRDMRHPQFEVIVVDNAPTTDVSRGIVASLGDSDVRYLRVDTPGLSRARNAGIRAAKYDHVAFTDDDVVVDSRWLQALGGGFAANRDVGCVTGLVASGQLESRSQRYFDRRVSWAQNTRMTVFRLHEPPAGVPLFPFQFGAYGTGANFAAKRSLLFELGGFDEALGAGSPTGSGEDSDLFVRVVLEGHALLYQPDAVVWHKHRIDDEGLSSQLESYGLGLGAVLAKLAGNPRALRAMAPLVVRAALHALRMVRVDAAAGEDAGSGDAYREFRGMLRGPLALHRARRNSLPRPLLRRNESTR